MTPKSKLSNTDFQMIRDAIQYNLEHLKVDLRLGRMDFFRHNADRICAMINGYISLGEKKADGDFGAYKSSCYASKRAHEQLQANGWKTEKGLLVFEHVIPIDFAGKLLLGKWESLGSMNDRALLKELNKLIIPCVLTFQEDKAIPWKKDMPDAWEKMLNQNWARYVNTDLPKPPAVDKAYTSAKLIDEIVALRPNLPHPPMYDKGKIRGGSKKEVPSMPIHDWPLTIEDRLDILLS